MQPTPHSFLAIITHIKSLLSRSPPMGDNIVKQTCEELELTQKELAEKIGASEGTVRNWSSSNELPKWAIMEKYRPISNYNFY